jgi:hypothetical protein
VTALSCAGKLGNCPDDLRRFRFTCLYCRWRRAYYHGWIKPSYWIKYTYRSSVKTVVTSTLTVDGAEYRLASGRHFKHVLSHYVLIDPRGHFTMVRCAAVVMFDRVMRWLGFRKPLVEFCEFLANYPTW